MDTMISDALQAHLGLTAAQINAIPAPFGIRWRMLPGWPVGELVTWHLVPTLMVWN